MAKRQTKADQEPEQQEEQEKSCTCHLELVEMIDGLQTRVQYLESYIDGRRQANQPLPDVPLKFSEDFETHLAYYRKGRSYMVPAKYAREAIDKGVAAVDSPQA